MLRKIIQNESERQKFLKWLSYDIVDRMRTASMNLIGIPEGTNGM